MNNRIYIPNSRSFRGRVFFVLIALMLGMGMALAGPAHGAELSQGTDGKLTGVVTVKGAGIAGVKVELRQRTNAGADSTIATATTADGGVYAFAKIASAPSDAFYYVHLAGGNGTLSAWYSFPIIYVQGSDFTVPTVEFADVQLLEPVAGATFALPGALRWNGRGAGETYRVFIYASGKTDKPVQDSGSLGTTTSYALGEGSLPDGNYEAIVQVRDAVSGYGQSQSRFRFTVGAAAAPPPPAEPQPEAQPPAQAEPTTAAEPPAEPAQPETEPVAGEEQGEGPDTSTQAGVDQPQVSLSLSADKTEVERGGTMIYKIEIENKGGAAAEDVVVTNLLPSGVTVDTSHARTSAGAVAVQGNSVTAQLGDMAPDAKVVVEIPVSVGTEAGTNISTQASAQYAGASNPVQSNAYIAQVAEPQTGVSTQPQTDPPAKPQEQQPQTKPQEVPPQAKPQEQQPQTKPVESKPAPPQSKPANTQTKQNAPMPQTGGSFPLFLAVALVTITLLARYLRGRNYRRV